MVSSSPSPGLAGPCDLLIEKADLVVTNDGRDIRGGWVSVRGGFIEAVGEPGREPPARETLDASGCLVTPGLVNGHHHMYQSLNRHLVVGRKFKGLVDWLDFYYPIWERLDEEAAYVSAWMSLATLALDGCTTSSDHLNIHPKRKLIDAEIQAAREIGIRFHPTRGAMNLSRKNGRLALDTIVESDDEIMADCVRLVDTYHDPKPGAMTRIALAPCNSIGVSNDLMRRAAELAEKLDVRLHTHLAESLDEENFCLREYGMRPLERFEELGWASRRTWVAHSIYMNNEEIAAMGKWGTSIAQCPTCNMAGPGSVAPVARLLAAGVNVGLSTDAAPSLRCELAQSRRFNREIHGSHLSARQLLEMATLGTARCLGRDGEIAVLRPGANADIVVWPLGEHAAAGTPDDVLEKWLEAGPAAPRDSIVQGKFIVRRRQLTNSHFDEIQRRHDLIAADWQRFVDAKV